MKELYWIANYDDKTVLGQFNPDGTENKYIDIDRDKLIRFDILEKESKKVIYSVFLREGQRLIYRRRTLINMGTGARVIVYLAGWQMNIFTNSGIKNMVVINYIHEDGSIALDGSRNNLELLEIEG